MQFGAFFMFLLRLIFLDFPLSSAKVAGVTGGAVVKVVKVVCFRLLFFLRNKQTKSVNINLIFYI